MSLSRLQTAAAAARRRRRQQASGDGGGGGGFPDVALFTDGTNWFVRTGNTAQPDGYFKQVGSDLFIDTTATSGLTISVVGSDLFVSVP